VIQLTPQKGVTAAEVVGDPEDVLGRPAQAVELLPVDGRQEAPFLLAFLCIEVQPSRRGRQLASLAQARQSPADGTHGRCHDPVKLSRAARAGGRPNHRRCPLTGSAASLRLLPGGVALTLATAV